MSNGYADQNLVDSIVQVGHPVPVMQKTIHSSFFIILI